MQRSCVLQMSALNLIQLIEINNIETYLKFHHTTQGVVMIV